MTGVLPREAIAVVLAGGFGTRVQHLLPNLPKPMATVEDKPFVEWVLRYLQAQGIPEAILATGYLGEAIADYFNPQPIANFKVSCCREPSPLGTAGGFVYAVGQYQGQISRSQSLPQAWLIANGDSLVCVDLERLFWHLNDPSVEGVMLGVPVADASRYGSLICDESGNLLTFAEKQPGVGIINGGVYLFRNRILAQFPDQMPLGFEQEVFPSLLAQGVKIRVETVDAPFLDIGTPETLPQAAAFIRANDDRFA